MNNNYACKGPEKQINMITNKVKSEDNGIILTSLR